MYMYIHVTGVQFRGCVNMYTYARVVFKLMQVYFATNCYYSSVPLEDVFPFLFSFTLFACTVITYSVCVIFSHHTGLKVWMSWVAFPQP